MVRPRHFDPSAHPETGADLPLFDPVLRGADYDPDLDRARLTSGLNLTIGLMRDGRWRTKDEIHEQILRDHDRVVSPESIGRYLRYAKEVRNGGWILGKRRRGDETRGLWEYRLTTGEAE